MKYLITGLFTFMFFNGFSQTTVIKDSSGIYGTAVYPTASVKKDTLKAILLITEETPGFTKSVSGFCVSQKGWCTGIHLSNTYRIIKYPGIVWQCVRLK